LLFNIVYKYLLFRLTGCTPFFGEDTEEIVSKNTLANVCFDFSEINISISKEGLLINFSP
jgi:hypothetical protein